MRRYPTQQNTGFTGAPLTKVLMIILLITFLVDIAGAGPLGRLQPWLGLSSDSLLEMWRWLTYPLVDLRLGGWLFGMIVLYSFGRMVEQSLGTRRFGMFLLFTTIAGAVIFSLASFQPGFQILTGTTGISFAIVTMTALLYPELTVRLLIPPVPLKMKNLAIGLLIIAAVMMIAQQRNAASSLAFLSGAGIAYLVSRKMQILDLGRSSVRKTPTKKAKRKPKKKSGMRPRTVLNVKESEVDKILDKVSNEGIGNLTDEEREILKFASKK